jgi:DNA-binding CsgD family transcriptional regulator
MSLPSTSGSGQLRRQDLRAALDVIGNLTDASDDANEFARCGVEQLPRLAAAELTTLPLRDMKSGRRHVIGVPPGAPDHAMAVPLYSGDGWLVSVVLNCEGRDFSDREVALFDQARSVIARMFRSSRVIERTREQFLAAASVPAPPALSPALPLTWREREVLRWAAAGKTDRDIADILAISHRTVHKHLQRVYSKLGVETRTAAVMRAIARPA